MSPTAALVEAIPPFAAGAVVRCPNRAWSRPIAATIMTNTATPPLHAAGSGVGRQWDPGVGGAWAGPPAVLASGEERSGRCARPRGHRPAGATNSRAPALWCLCRCQTIERPPQIELGTFQGDGLPAPEGVPAGPAGDAADAETGFDGALDRFGMFQFHADGQGRRNAPAGPVPPPAGCGARFAQDPGLAEELLEATGPRPARGMVRAGEDHQFVVTRAS